MAKAGASLQDYYLNQLRREEMPVTVFLVNGFQLRGTVRSFDSFTVLLESEGRQLLVYKHALSTITPARAITFSPGDAEPAAET